MAIKHLNHPVLQEIIGSCDDKFQGYAAFSLYLRLCEQFKLEQVEWNLDSVLKMVILETHHDGVSKIFLPLHYTYRPCPKWIRETTLHMKIMYPESSFHLAFSSSNQTFVMYRTSSDLEMPKNQDLEVLRKAQSISDVLNVAQTK